MSEEKASRGVVEDGSLRCKVDEPHIRMLVLEEISVTKVVLCSVIGVDVGDKLVGVRLGKSYFAAISHGLYHAVNVALLKSRYEPEEDGL